MPHDTRRRPTGRAIVVTVAALLAVTAALPAQTTRLYPAIEPNATGELQVSDTHTLYWETSGNEAGIPLIALHGGPGGGSSATLRRLFDPERYRIIQFDQRGGRKSRPFAEWRDNTTADLVEDINRLRAHLNVDAPAGLVLLGVFTCRQQEIDHYYHGGVAPFYPKAWQMLRGAVPNPEAGEYPRQLFEVISGPSTERATLTARTFVTYEEWLSTSGGVRDAAEEEAADPTSRSMAVLENYYLMNGCFLAEGQLLDRAPALGRTPVFIGNGRFDMLTPAATAIALADRLEHARLEIVPGSGHVDLAVALAGVRGGNWVLEELGRRENGRRR